MKWKIYYPSLQSILWKFCELQLLLHLKYDTGQVLPKKSNKILMYKQLLDESVEHTQNKILHISVGIKKKKCIAIKKTNESTIILNAQN